MSENSWRVTCTRCGRDLSRPIAMFGWRAMGFHEALHKRDEFRRTLGERIRRVFRRREQKPPQGVYCCAGKRIEVTHDAVDQTISYLEGDCPNCGSHWSVQVDSGGNDDASDD